MLTLFGKEQRNLFTFRVNILIADTWNSFTKPHVHFSNFFWHVANKEPGERDLRVCRDFLSFSLDKRDQYSNLFQIRVDSEYIVAYKQEKHNLDDSNPKSD
jgi:hypothetical protein